MRCSVVGRLAGIRLGQMRLTAELRGNRVKRRQRVQRLCLPLPKAFELEAWDRPTFRVGSGRGKIFCTAAPDGSTLTVKADPVEREALLARGDPFYCRPTLATRAGRASVRSTPEPTGRRSPS
jgi:YjbR